MAVNQSLLLELIDQDPAGNHSRVRVFWQSVQNNGSYNLYERTAYFYVSVNGGQETRFPVIYTLPKNAAGVIADQVITVPHDDAGRATLTVRTWMDTRISAGVVEMKESLPLPDIPRASRLTLAPDAVALLGEDRSVTATITPAAAGYRHVLTLALGEFSQSQTLEPGVTEAEIPVPMVLACHMAEGQGAARVILASYAGEVFMGTHEEALTLTAEAYAAPIISGFAAERCGADGTPEEDGLYVQVRGQIRFSSLGGWNQIAATVACRDAAGGSWQETGSFDPAGENIYPLPGDGEYELRLLVRDRFTESYALQILDTGEVLMEYHAGEKRLEFKPHVSVPSLGLCDVHDAEKAALQLSAAGEAVLSLGPMLQKVFRNGVWVGNTGPAARTGVFTAQAGDSGFFIDTADARVYVVAGENMQNVYTGDAVARFG